MVKKVYEENEDEGIDASTDDSEPGSDSDDDDSWE